MKSENTDGPLHGFPACKLLRALAVFGTATFLIPVARALVSEEKDTPEKIFASDVSSEQPRPESKLGPSRFQRLPSLAGPQESLAIYSSEGFPKFSPLPSLDDLPEAPAGLVELAQSLSLENVPLENALQQGTKSGSDFDSKSVKTEGVGALQKPLAPLDILKKTDAISSKPDVRDFIEPSMRGSMQGNGLQNTPDPRYFRHWPANQASWASPAFCYKPLYFEQINLERYGIGYSCPTNALVSGGKFFADATLLPVKLIRNPPHSCECTLGHRRPGDCTPLQKPVR